MIRFFWCFLCAFFQHLHLSFVVFTNKEEISNSVAWFFCRGYPSVAYAMALYLSITRQNSVKIEQAYHYIRNAVV